MQRMLGKYRLESELARGGMGAVWIAHDEGLERRVAIKIMHEAIRQAESALRRFEREARIVAGLRTPYIVQTYDYGVTDDGDPYLVMELLEGETLAQRLARTQPAPMSVAAFSPLFLQIARGLAVAHRAGVIHRDLKPANIFLVDHGGELTVKILDFGIASIHASHPSRRPLTSPLTQPSELLGTPHYMSPEQTRAEPIDPRSDLWSLAVLGYEALTGALPFEAENLTALLVQICTSPHGKVSARVPGLGPDIDSFFDRALAKHPSARYASALDMAVEFQALTQPREGSKAIEILVIDDEPDIVALVKQRFRRQLRSKRYGFVFAGDGQAALDQLRAHPEIEIALTDINMPVMDGLTFLAEARRMRPTLTTIVISAYGDMSNIRAAMNRGAYDFLLKPLDFKDLEHTIERAVRRLRQQHRAERSVEENDVLRRFVDPSVVERLLATGPASGPVSGEKLEATVAVIAVHGFSRYARDASAHQAIQLLERSFDVITSVLADRRCPLVRFLGDAIMAVFSGADHVCEASRACLDIRDRFEQLAAGQNPGSAYAPGTRSGISSGQVILGVVGSPSAGRFDYTALGDVVDTALALYKLADVNQILLPRFVTARLPDSFRCEPTDKSLAGHADGDGRAVGDDGQAMTVYSVENRLDVPIGPGADEDTLPMSR